MKKIILFVSFVLMVSSQGFSQVSFKKSDWKIGILGGINNFIDDKTVNIAKSSGIQLNGPYGSSANAQNSGINIEAEVSRKIGNFELFGNISYRTNILSDINFRSTWVDSNFAYYSPELHTYAPSISNIYSFGFHPGIKYTLDLRSVRPYFSIEAGLNIVNTSYNVYEGKWIPPSGNGVFGTLTWSQTLFKSETKMGFGFSPAIGIKIPLSQSIEIDVRAKANFTSYSITDWNSIPITNPNYYLIVGSPAISSYLSYSALLGIQIGL